MQDGAAVYLFVRLCRGGRRRRARRLSGRLLLFAAGTSAQTQRAAGRLWQRSDGAHPADVLVEGRRCGGARQGRQHRGVCRDVSVGGRKYRLLGRHRRGVCHRWRGVVDGRGRAEQPQLAEGGQQPGGGVLRRRRGVRVPLWCGEHSCVRGGVRGGSLS